MTRPLEIDLTKLADASELSELAVTTAPFEVSVGVVPTSLLPPRPELNGQQFKLPDEDGVKHPEVYLVDQGYRRHIKDPSTYKDLFVNTDRIVVTKLLVDIPEGPEIAHGTVLARGDGTAPIYLVEQGIKRWILTPHTMDVYYFAWDRVYVVPPVLLLSIADGSAISA